MTLYHYKAKLVRVIDGDTVDVMIDLGFDVWIKKRLRLYGIDAPETRTRNLELKKKGKASTKRLEELLNEEEFRVLSHGNDKYGRCLASIFRGKHVISVNEVLISEGFASKYV